MIKKGSEEFSGYNKPKAAPKHRIKLRDIETEYVLEEFGDRLRREALKKYYPEKDIEME